MLWFFFFFQAEDGIRDLVRSRGLGDVYKRQILEMLPIFQRISRVGIMPRLLPGRPWPGHRGSACLLYTSDAADERSSVDLGGRRIIKKKNKSERRELESSKQTKI